MTSYTEFAQPELEALYRVMNDSLLVRTHHDLFRWLRGGVQDFIPHDVLIAAWGDFKLGLVQLDVTSQLPGMRTLDVDQAELLPFLFRLFGRWKEAVPEPFVQPLNDRGALPIFSRKSVRHQALLAMRSALVLGIRDERGRNDCLYVAMSSTPAPEARATPSMRLLLPYIDAALRRVAQLPARFPEILDQDGEITAGGELAAESGQPGGGGDGLSEREREIMRWVCLGKTNPEIGAILDISYFTVKNHLQRIFRKLNVTNRAQAVSMFKATTRPRRTAKRGQVQLGTPA